MFFDKKAQRLRAENYSKDQIANGIKVTVFPPLPVLPPIVAPVIVTTSKVKHHKGFVAEPFTNNLDQVINPGDDVVVIATGYNHSIKTLRGVFLGVNKTPTGKITSASIGNIKTRLYKSGSYIDHVVRRSYPRKRVYALK